MPIPTGEFVLAVLLAAAGGVFLLTRRCQLSIMQWIVGLFVHGIILAVLFSLPSEDVFLEGNERAVQIFAGTFLLMGPDLFLAAYYAQRIRKEGLFWEWAFFIGGLLVIPTLLPAVLATTVLLLGGPDTELRRHPLGWLICAILWIPFITTVFLQVYLHEDAEQHRAADEG